MFSFIKTEKNNNNKTKVNKDQLTSGTPSRSDKVTKVSGPFAKCLAIPRHTYMFIP